MTGYTFQPLYAHGVPAGDPVAQRFMDLARQRGVDPVSANTAANVMAKAMREAKDKGQRWSNEDLASAFISFARNAGIPEATARELTGTMRAEISTGQAQQPASLPSVPDPSPHGFTHAELDRVERWLDRLEAKGADVERFLDVGQTPEGVRWLQQLQKHSEAGAAHPGPAPGTDWQPSVAAIPASPGGNDGGETAPATAPDAFPTARTGGPSHLTSTPPQLRQQGGQQGHTSQGGTAVANANDGDRRARRENLHRKVADPRYSRDPEFRQKVEQEFREEYGDGPAGSSPAGVGVPGGTGFTGGGTSGREGE